MTKAEKEAWLKEAKMQMQAIATLEKYNIASLATAGVGAALCYFAVTAANRNPLFIVCSLILAIFGAVSSMVLNLGIRNGKRNVEKILNAVEGKEEKVVIPDRLKNKKKRAAPEKTDDQAGKAE
jgi:hypothetical protein